MNENSIQRIVLTGGPGSGKTTVLDVLRSQGYATGRDAARSIIRQRKREGLPPRPDARAFAQQVFEMEVETYHSVQSSPSFFERGIVDATGSLLQAGALSEAGASRVAESHPYQLVFVFPPWEEIYCTDDERDHTFDHSVRVYEATVRLYRRYDYEPIDVPPGTVGDRVDFLLERTRSEV